MVQLVAIHYDAAEQTFIDLLQMEQLDAAIEGQPSLISEVELLISEAIAEAYHASAPAHQAHQFLQRILYRINRLKLFWYDDLAHYVNENSTYLNRVRNYIESAWQKWELTQLDIEALQPRSPEAVKQALYDRCAADVDPLPSASGRYFRDEMTIAGYRRLLAIASLDGLVEASQLSRTLGGVGNDIQAVLTRLLVEEYGAGRLNRKHSTFFTTMLTTLEMDPTPEAYFD